MLVNMPFLLLRVNQAQDILEVINVNIKIIDLHASIQHFYALYLVQAMAIYVFKYKY